MKQILIKSGKAILQEVPAPTITDPNEILVKTSYSLISKGTELTALKYSEENIIKKAKRRPDAVKAMIKHMKENGIISTFNIAIDQLDYVLGQQIGYSASGVVQRVGSNVKSIQPGDKVACGGVGYANHAEIIKVPKNLVVKIPENISLLEAASTTVGSICMQSIRRAEPKIGEYIGVIGLGLMGLITIQILKANGCIVIGIDPDEKKRKKAIELGADYVFHPNTKETVKKTISLSNNQGVDTTIITAATESNEPLQQAMEITRKKGKVVLLGIIGREIQQNPYFRKEIDLLVSTSYGPGRYDPEYEEKSIDYPYAYVRWTENRNMQAYLQLISEKKIKIQELITKKFYISESKKAFDYLKKSEDSLMVFLTYNTEKVDESTNIILKPKQNNKKINLAIIGAGWISKQEHLPNIKNNKYFNIHTIVDRSPVNAHKTAKFFKACKSSTNYQDAIKDPEIDCILIATKHNSHKEIIIESAKNKKAIFCEKPLALTKEDIQQIKEVITKENIPFMVGYNRRFSPHIKAIKEGIKNKINPIVAIYRVNAGPLDISHWLQDPKIGGGRLIGEACHMFDVFNYLTNSKPKKINVAKLNSKTKEYPPQDNIVVSIEYEDGSLCTLIYTSLGNKGLQKEYLEIYADGDIYVVDDYKELRIYGTTNIKEIKGTQDKGLKQELIEWGKYLSGNSEIPITLQESILATDMSIEVNANLFME